MRGSEVTAGSPPDPLAVRPPDGFEPVRVLGSGVYGTTLLCRETARDGREAVVVVLRPRPAAADERARFHTELLAAAAAARHPCTARVRDVVGTEDGTCCLVTDWYPGGAFPADAPVPVGEVVLAGIRAALSLRAAHRRGVLHLDVRPGALVRGADGEVHLTGHGVARAVERADPAVRRAHDPAFAPRELAGWEPPGPACDVAMLGATMSALLRGPGAAGDGGPEGSGAPLVLPGEPAAGLTPAVLGPPPDDVAFAYRALAGERVATGGAPVPPALAALLRRMVAANPADRPSIAEVHGALRALVPTPLADRVPDLLPEPAEPDPLAQPDPPEEPYEDEEDDPDHDARQRRRRRWLVTMAVAGAVLFAGGAFAIVRMDHGGGKKAPEAGSSPSASAPAGGPGGPARLLTPSQGAQYAPRDVTTAAFGDSVQVAWQPPSDAAAQAQVAGYLVLAQNPRGAAVDRRDTSSRESNVVFTLPRTSAPAPPICYTVTTLVRLPDNALGLAPAEQVCPAQPSGTPSARPGSSGTSAVPRGGADGTPATGGMPGAATAVPGGTAGSATANATAPAPQPFPTTAADADPARQAQAARG
ncbi:hypothetical protein LO772_26450 [Yinghuangia sp. ASG 101]|uniref:protein kinase domain-containing protein n=1 Tax=Yinghuangia sp. ASG 101 TaxID=2896848 RepID=UPI001E5AE0B8|nr:hypothetical protein [Yinghuangia sp. ASG 101]UGQ10375.1 hypothetical protein LO772_26450 [Yinghuangia sp. ASG 101]